MAQISSNTTRYKGKQKTGKRIEKLCNFDTITAASFCDLHTACKCSTNRYHFLLEKTSRHLGTPK